MEKNFKRILFILIILILLITLLIIFLNNKVEENKNKKLIESYNLNNKLEKISDINDYICIKECIKKYIEYSTDLENKEQFKSIFPIDVLNELKINDDDDLFEKLGIANNKLKINNIYKSMQSLNINAYEEETSIYAYYVEYMLVDEITKEKQDENIIIVIDKINQTFLIIPQTYIEEKNIIISEGIQINIYEEESIDNKEYNICNVNNINDELFADEIYDDLKNLLYFPESLYEMLDEEYKKERFDSYEKLQSYIEKYNDKIQDGALSKYSVEKGNLYVEYTLLDTNQNAFVIRVNDDSIKYTVFLDNYTIKSQDYENRYLQLSDEDKVKNNISMYMYMINTGDYVHAYKMLDEEFKKNKFSDEQAFSQFVENNFYDYNFINIEEVEKQVNFYVCKVKIKSNIGRDSEQKDIRIIMKLKDKTDFVMSFDFN